MIKRFKIFGWLLMGAILVLNHGAVAQTFDALKWDHRVLVLSADEDSSQAQEQIILLSEFMSELEERELIVLRLNNSVLRKIDELSPFPFQTQILDNREERRYLESIFPRDDIGEGNMGVTLVGFDGEIKERWEGVVEPSDVFDVIDAMPMRQRELGAQ